MAMVVPDDSFKKPGAIPFDWETRPGVSRFQHHNHEQPPPPSPSSSTASSSSPSKELQNQWLQSMSLSSNSKTLPSSFLTRLKLVSRQSGCFPTTWLKWRWGKEKVQATPKLKLKLEMDPECIKDYTFYLEKLAQWSTSTSFQRSSSSSFSSRMQRSSSQSTTSHHEVVSSRLVQNLFGVLKKPKMIGMERKGREIKKIDISIYVNNN